MNLKKTSSKKFQSIYISFLLISLIVLLINFYLNPKYSSLSFFSLIGFILIIYVIFNNFSETSKEKVYSINVKLINEFNFKSFILILSFSFFLPSSNNYKMIMDWNQINSFTYLRTIILLFSILYLPGSNLYNLFFKNRDLNTFKDNSFIFKLTIYPFLSLTFIGSITFIFDRIGLAGKFYPILLFLLIFFFTIIDLFLNRHQFNLKRLIKNYKITLKRYSINFFLLIIAVILISSGIYITNGFFLEGDTYESISYASFIGDLDGSIIPYTYNLYWGYIAYGLSSYCGFPYVNLNVFLFPLLFSFITSIFFFLRALFSKFNNKDIILIISIIIISSNAIFFFNSISIRARDLVSSLIFDLMFNFRYKGFSIFLTIFALSLFIKLDTVQEKNRNTKIKYNYYILIAWFLIQSYLLYFISIIFAGIFIFIYSFYYKNHYKTKSTFKTTFFIVIFFILFDLISGFFFSWTPTSFITIFLETLKPDKNKFLVYNALFVYIILMILLWIIHYTRNNYNLKIKKRKIIKKIILLSPIFIIISISIELFMTILFPFQFNNILKGNFMNFIDFLLYYNHKFFFNLGTIGLLGLFFSYFIYKRGRKRLSYFLISWFILIFLLSSALFYIACFEGFIYNKSFISDDTFTLINIWFDRFWIISIFPLSISTTIGIIELLNFLKKIKIKKTYQIIIKKFFLPTFLISLSLSNTILACSYWSSIEYNIDNNEAQIIGWVESNIPKYSNILVDRFAFLNRLDKIAFCNPLLIHQELEEALEGISYEDDSDNYCDIEVIEDLNYSHFVLKLRDMNDNGSFKNILRFSKSFNYGNISFGIKSDNFSNHIYIYFQNSYDEISFSLIIKENSLYCYNYSDYVLLTNLNNNENNIIKISFNLNQSVISKPEEGFYEIKCQKSNETISKTLLINPNITNIEKIFISSRKEEKNFYYLIDYFVLDSENITYYDLFYPVDMVIEYLISNSIFYYIKSESETYASNKAKNLIPYFNITDKLLLNYYINKDYEYGDLTFYSTE